MKQTFNQIRIMFLLLASLVVLVSQSIPQNVVKEKRTHVQASEVLGFAMPAELEEEDLEENTNDYFRLIALPMSFRLFSLSEEGSILNQLGLQHKKSLVGSKRLILLCVFRI